MYWSGVTMPDTIASPRPQLAFTTSSSTAVVSGLAVNSTPDDSGEIMAWMTTAMLTDPCSIPIR